MSWKRVAYADKKNNASSCHNSRRVHSYCLFKILTLLIQTGLTLAERRSPDVGSDPAVAIAFFCGFPFLSALTSIDIAGIKPQKNKINRVQSNHLYNTSRLLRILTEITVEDYTKTMDPLRMLLLIYWPLIFSLKRTRFFQYHRFISYCIQEYV